MISRRHNNGGAVAPAVNISNPMNRVRNSKGRLRSEEVAVYQRVAFAVAIAIILLYIYTSGNTGFDSEKTTANTNDVSSRRAFEEGIPLGPKRDQSINSKIRSRLETNQGPKRDQSINSKIRSRLETNQKRMQKQRGHQSPSPGDGPPVLQRLSVRSSTSDQVLRYLLKYARQTPGDLWDTLGVTASPDVANSYSTDLFSLKELEDGSCPWRPDTQVEWLPDVPFNSDEIATEYRSRMDALGSGGLTRRQMKELDEKRKVLIWYEHISKGE